MPNILLKIAYDGSAFFGYQLQIGQNVRTVQGELGHALRRMHRGVMPEFHAAGRTDRGVHAEGQYINVQSDLSSIPPDRFSLGLNSYLPPDIRALTSREVPATFHARYSGRWRLYRYVYCLLPIILPQYRSYASPLDPRCSVERLNRDIADCVGTQDFSSFACSIEEGYSAIRTVRYAHYSSEGDFLHMYISANGFLRGMVRSITGTIVDRELQRLRGWSPKMSITDILQSKRRSVAGTSAGPQGLTLVDVEYDE